jgi:putative ABC transport system permease protein
MNGWESIVSAFMSLRAHKLRSFLTLLGIIVAVTSIIAVVTVINGLNSKVTDLVTGRGADVFILDRMGTSDVVYRRDKLWGGNRSVDDMMVRGVGTEFPFLSTFEIERGRHLAPLEIERARPVAVIGHEVAEELFPTSDPIDDTVRVRGRHFTVVGIAKPQGTVFGATQDDFVVIPLSSWQKIYDRRASVSISIKAADPDNVQGAIDETRMLMRVRHRLRPAQADDFGFITTQEFLELYAKVTTGVYSALVGLVAISLLVGGIVVMNIMLVAVTERTREIGIRKALGARRRDVLRQFLVEAVILAALGGVIGVGLGFAIAVTISKVTPLPYSLTWWSIALGIGLASVVGIAFGIYPAAKAARLDPIVALRYE